MLQALPPLGWQKMNKTLIHETNKKTWRTSTKDYGGINLTAQILMVSNYLISCKATKRQH